ncbi:hypothetical protein BDV95DRAFT_224441 [Massariosphaeria phaeospora]|uniref:Uncharacterized protein n=1 Tax=Massariosphaeria phaeospora TaxID=100035 RepID=A0A7C8IFC3_9PLEO|nr:hypothetical protein BDV95DRAFT_224441 [Massariosphaeria phaeospora]
MSQAPASLDPAASDPATAAMIQVINGLRRVSLTYNQNTLIKDYMADSLAQLRQEQASLPANDPALLKMSVRIAAYENATAVQTEYFAALKSHDARYRAGLRRPEHSDPKVLAKYVADDTDVYGKMVARHSSRLFMALKPADPKSSEKTLAKIVSTTLKDYPEIAARVRTLDTDKKKKRSSSKKKK